MKKIPIYNDSDIEYEEKAGNFAAGEFADFISQLLDADNELSSKERRFIKEVEEYGTELLNEKQKNSLQTIVNRYQKRCIVCDNKIPLNEVFNLEKYCNNHNYLSDKEN